jgi:hypothetical protein
MLILKAFGQGGLQLLIMSLAPNAILTILDKLLRRFGKKKIHLKYKFIAALSCLFVNGGEKGGK